MDEWVAILLTAVIVTFFVWIVLTFLIGVMHGDIVDGAFYSFLVVLVIWFIIGVGYGLLALVFWIWSAVPS